MFFDVTYADPARVPRLLAHAVTLVAPDGSGPGTPTLTNPVPVGCKQMTVLRPPVVGHGWTAFSGCCALAAYHRDVVAPVNGLLQVGQQFAIDYEQIGPNRSCCTGGPYQALNSWVGIAVANKVCERHDAQRMPTITTMCTSQRHPDVCHIVAWAFEHVVFLMGRLRVLTSP